MKHLAEVAYLMQPVLPTLQWTIRPLKPKIKKAYSYLSTASNQFDDPSRSYFLWIRLVDCLRHNVLHLRYKFPDDTDLRGSILALEATFRYLANFAAAVKRNLSVRNKFWAHLHKVAVRIKNLICSCWVEDELDEKMGEEMIAMVSDLQQIMKPNDPEALEIYWCVLTNLYIHPNMEESVRPFAQFLLSVEDGAKTLEDVLVFLITFLISTPSKHSESVQQISVDIKQLAREASTLNDGTRGSVLEAKALPVNFFGKVNILLAEAFVIQLQISKPLFEGISECRIETLLEELELPSTFPTSSSAILISTRIGAVVSEARSVHHSFQVNKITEYIAKNALFKLLLKIKLLKAEIFLMELLNSGTDSVLSVEDLTENLLDGLQFLTETVTNLSDKNSKDDMMILTHIEAVAKGTISICHSFHAAEITEETIDDMKLLVSDLQNKIKLVKAELKQILLASRMSFPKTNGLGFIDFLLGNIRKLLNYNADQVASVKPQIEALMADLEIIMSMLKEIVENETENEELKDLVQHAIDLSYEAEYEIDLFVIRNGAKGPWRIGYVLEEIRLVKMQVTKIYEDKTYDVAVSVVAPKLRRTISHASTPTVEEVMVDLKDQEDLIIDRLTRGSLQQDIVSIVGMPGIGKTTLGKKVYNSPQVTYHFHIRAWCRVSQVYQKRELLLDILSDIVDLPEDMLEESDEDLELRLYQQLKMKKYLIVMDDVWSFGALEDLGLSFPNDENGSRILVTTRLHRVALRAKSRSNPHLLRLLSDDESWILLQKKLFPGKDCPEELLKVGHLIAKNCQGLPLAVVAIAGLLQRTEKKKDRWEQIAESLSSRIVDDPETRCKDILELSYEHLPECLKPCLLYLAALLEDKEITVLKLTRLWIAEGFIPETTLESSEDVAEEYLRELIQSSLVLVARRRSDGGVKACRVHDMLRDLCLARCKEEKFLQLETRYDDLFADASDGLDYGVDPDYSYPSNPTMIYEEYRLFISCKRKHFVMSRPSGKHVRSLMFSAVKDLYPRCPYDISFVSQNCELLRVLDLECINMGNSFPSEMLVLVQLRFLAVCGDINRIPSSIASLWNLETFLVKGLKGKVLLPDSIWSMQRLRHLHVNDHAAFTSQDEKPENSSQLENLVTFSSPFLSSGETTTKIMRRLPKLRKLKCIFSESRVNSLKSNQFPALDHLTELESLKTIYHGRIGRPGEFGFPLNLKKLTLSKFRLPWNCIEEIGRLPNLKVLKLLSKAYEGKIWDMGELEFKELEFLKLDSISFRKWIASSDNLPKLQRLVLRNCKQLEEVPSGFAEIQTLQLIELQLCRHSAEESVKRLKEEQVDLGNEELKVLINLSNWDMKSSR